MLTGSEQNQKQEEKQKELLNTTVEPQNEAPVIGGL